MKNDKKNEYSLRRKYDQYNEEIFVTPKNDNEYPFWVCSFGTTFPDPNYHEIRMNSAVSCIEYVVSGSGVVINNNHPYAVKKGDSYILMEGSNHNYYSNHNDPFEKIWVNFKGVFSKEITKIYNLTDVVVFKNTCVAPYIKEIQEICRDTNNSTLDIQNKASHVYLSAIQFLSHKYNKITMQSDLIEIIKYYIDCHITDNLKLDELAKMFGVSRDHFIRLFKKDRGVTPHQYIIDSKMKMATIMLVDTDTKIETIAENLGFNDITHFSSLFEKKLGVRPSEYRKQKQHQGDKKNDL